MTYTPLRIQVRDARRGQLVSTSWMLPPGWPGSTEFGTPLRRVVLGVEKRTRAGSTGRMRWFLFEDRDASVDDRTIARGFGTWFELETALSALHLAV